MNYNLGIKLDAIEQNQKIIYEKLLELINVAGPKKIDKAVVKKSGELSESELNELKE